MVINGAIVSDLDMMYLESVLQEEQALCMMMRYVHFLLMTLLLVACQTATNTEHDQTSLRYCCWLVGLINRAFAIRVAVI